jgi:hypothetical protein
MRKLLACIAAVGFVASAPLAYARPAPVNPSPGPAVPHGPFGGSPGREGGIFRLPQPRIEPPVAAAPPQQAEPQERPAPRHREVEPAPKSVEPPATRRDVEPPAPRHDAPPPDADAPKPPLNSLDDPKPPFEKPAPPIAPPVVLPHRADRTDVPQHVSFPKAPALTAEKDAVDAARTAPSQHFDPVAPPLLPGDRADPVRQAEQISARTPDVERDDRGVVRPHQWSFIDHDRDGHPMFFNPVGTDMTFRYFYRGAYRDVFVPAGANVVLDVIDAGLFPFTAVGGDLVTAGAFTGGGFTPLMYDNVAANVVSADRTVQLDSVQLVGHDEARPLGEQDAMMLNGTTLAYGTVKDPSHVDVGKVQTLPGVGPMDDGTHWVNAAFATPLPPSHTRAWLLGGALAVALASMGTIAGVFIRRRRSLAHTAVAYSDDPHEPTQWMNGPYQ